APRTEAFGALSVKVSYWATARIVGEVSSAVFLPRPRVASSLVEIERRPTPAVAADRPVLFGLVRHRTCGTKSSRSATSGVATL
ncbi:MAG: 16S rRNA (adenine(1518)-N(6)/adenine(1519)-N(6))-dimethyltransferase, partial [Actinobacteria bacterium]|nr:16S rRNA (adenine(1518)-N(6)/adenine(1519)-N(6))-dimethyltransferase [Actinomycetota bacterium]